MENNITDILINNTIIENSINKDETIKQKENISFNNYNCNFFYFCSDFLFIFCSICTM